MKVTDKNSRIRIRSRIRICTKMSCIRRTGRSSPISLLTNYMLSWILNTNTLWSFFLLHNWELFGLGTAAVQTDHQQVASGNQVQYSIQYIQLTNLFDNFLSLCRVCERPHKGFAVRRLSFKDLKVSDPNSFWDPNPLFCCLIVASWSSIDVDVRTLKWM